VPSAVAKAPNQVRDASTLADEKVEKFALQTVLSIKLFNF